MSSIPSWTGRLDPRDVLPRRVIHRLSRLDGPPGCPRPVRELSVRPPYFNVSQRIPRDDRPGSSQVESLCCVYVSATRQGLLVGGRYWDRTSDLCRVEAYPPGFRQTRLPHTPQRSPLKNRYTTERFVCSLVLWGTASFVLIRICSVSGVCQIRVSRPSPAIGPM